MKEEIILKTRNLSVAYHKKPVLWDINVDLPKGKLIAIIGPNGAGKSTFIKSVLDIIPRLSGKVEFLGKSYKQVQKFVSYVPQRKSVDWDYPVCVRDLVSMGLYSDLKWYQRLNTSQYQKISEALTQVDLLQFANRQINQLSGGQQQRAFMARSLVQDADIYLMDEPFAGIDIASEKAILGVINVLKEKNKTIIIVHHNLSMIKEYFDYVMMLNLRLIASGPVKEVFTEKNLNNTYMGRLTLLEDVTQAMLEKNL